MAREVSEARERAVQKSGVGKSSSNSVVTMFVSNISHRIHRKGLWASFAHHGEVVDVFIPLKRSKDGSRFGFVRFSNMIDAQRAISRSYGFFLLGSWISVSLARFNPRTKFWEKPTVKSHNKEECEFVNKEPNSSVTTVHKFVEGISDMAVMERLSSCIIGSTIKPYNVEKLIECMEGKGLIEFEVHQISGN
ncbi:hypothetical protein V6N13_088320 [Hibiscus sabdariffa]